MYWSVLAGGTYPSWGTYPGWGTPPGCEQTDTCENSTFPLPLDVGGKNVDMSHLQVRESKRLGCHADVYTVNRCCTRGESEDLISEKAYKGFTMALKSRADVTRSPKQGYQWPHKKDSCPPKNYFKKITKSRKSCSGSSRIPRQPQRWERQKIIWYNCMKMKEIWPRVGHIPSPIY